MVLFVNLEGERPPLLGTMGIIIWLITMRSIENSAINMHLSLFQESSKPFKIQQDPCGGRDETCMGPSFGFRDLIMKKEMTGPGPLYMRDRCEVRPH